jgi:mgtE-like transporter
LSASFKRVFKQALIALSFDLGGILSGRIVLALSPLFESSLWILALFPPILAIRGNIGGIFSGKLGTMLHLGVAETKFRGNTQDFYALIGAVTCLTFINTLCISFFAFIVNLAFGNVTFEHLRFFLVVPLLTCLVAIAISIPITSLLGFNVFKKGLDPDIIIYPAMSTIDDILVTVCYATLVYIVLMYEIYTSIYLIALILGSTSIVIIVLFAKFRRERVFRRALLEGAPAVLLTSSIATFGGVGLASLRVEIERRPSVLLLYPALIDTLGDIGAILGSMEATKLALGYMSSLKEAFSDLMSVEAAAIIIHVLFGITAFLLGKATNLSPDLISLITISLAANLISFLLIFFFSLGVARETFKHGLDPDNFVIPAVTSVSDITSTLSLIAVIALLMM